MSDGKKNKNIYDRHESRLHTTSETGTRVYVYPEEVHGIWRHRRNIVYAIKVLFFLALPWITWNGKQVFLLDVGNRYFNIFGLDFYAHDVPYIIFVLLFFTLSVAAVTSIWGRVWCGWACPQTVFTETFYRFFERLVEGNSRQQYKLDQEKLSFKKVRKKVLKWTLFILISLFISYSFVRYFVAFEDLSITDGTFTFAHGAILFFTGLFAFDFGYFREQFCIIMCPYGRLQSLFMDKDSMVVSYDVQRGGPYDERGSGDCVHCYQCVKVCPTGIDIRKGLQLECVTCTACIDACDEIMDRVKKPRGLIKYSTENKDQGITNHKSKRKFLYLAAMVLVVLAFAFTLERSNHLSAKLIKKWGRPFSEFILEEQEYISNGFTMELFARSKKSGVISIAPTSEEFAKGVRVTTTGLINYVGGTKKRVNVYFRFPKKLLKDGRYQSKLEVDFDAEKDWKVIKEVNLVGPF